MKHSIYLAGILTLLNLFASTRLFSKNNGFIPVTGIIEFRAMTDTDDGGLPLGGSAGGGIMTPTGTLEQVLNPLMAFNFTGDKRGLSNLTPVVDYGFQIPFALTKKSNTFTGIFAVNPYVAGQISVEDSVTFLPGIMLPGNAGIRVDLGFTWNMNKKASLTLFPCNFGYKLISNFADSGINIFQHNLRTALVFELKNTFILGAQYTMGWHNSTSESERAFTKYFKRQISEVQYLLISAQIKINAAEAKSPNFLFAEWRGMFNGGNWGNLPNTRIFTLGLRKSISISNAVPAKGQQNHPGL